MIVAQKPFNDQWRLLAGSLLVLWYCGPVAAQSNEAPAESPTEALPKLPTPIEPVDPGPCKDLNYDSKAWLDRTQRTVYRTVCNTALWFDGFFGDQRFDGETGDTYGRLGLSSFLDERDGLDARLRLRARFALPALNHRGAILLGRGDEKEIVDERTSTDYDALPSNFNDLDDEAWLLGLGFEKGGLKRGFKFSVGAKLRARPQPYAKGTYRRSVSLSRQDLARFRQILFWRDAEGFGSTTQLDIDHLVSDRLMLRWANYGTVSEDKEVEGLEWGSTFTLFQSLSDRRALSYRALIRGETKAEVRYQNVGFEVRYRRRLMREWLFVELISSVTWPKELLTEERKANFGVGIGFEMYFGPVPDAQMR